MAKKKQYSKTPEHLLIRERGLTIAFLEKEMQLPKNTLNNFINGYRPLKDEYKAIVKKIFKKYKINLVV